MVDGVPDRSGQQVGVDGGAAPDADRQDDRVRCNTGDPDTVASCSDDPRDRGRVVAVLIDAIARSAGAGQIDPRQHGAAQVRLAAIDEAVDHGHDDALARADRPGLHGADLREVPLLRLQGFRPRACHRGLDQGGGDHQRQHEALHGTESPQGRPGFALSDDQAPQGKHEVVVDVLLLVGVVSRTLAGTAG